MSTPDPSPVPAPRRRPRLSPLRTGAAYGPVLTRLGDIYSPVVNMASRLTSIARPGSPVALPVGVDQVRGRDLVEGGQEQVPGDVEDVAQHHRVQLRAAAGLLLGLLDHRRARRQERRGDRLLDAPGRNWGVEGPDEEIDVRLVSRGCCHCAALS